jgi:single-strand DNA-binding protein
MWRGLAEVAEKYVTKGKQLYIEGKIKTRSWDDKDGNKRYTTEIVADVMQLLGNRTDSQAPATNGGSSQSESSAFESPDSSDQGGDDDLPF